VTGGNAVFRAGVSRSGAWDPGVSRFGLSRSRPRRGALDTCLMLIDGGTCIPTMASPF
jgi:hypothetical protein